jgi:Rod binding domain-containing protein
VSAPIPAASTAQPGAAHGAKSKIHEVAQKFEGLILSQLLKQGLGGGESGEGGLFGNGAEAGVYQGFVETFLAEHLSRSGGLGLARVLERSLGGNSAGSSGGRARS